MHEVYVIHGMDSPDHTWQKRMDTSMLAYDTEEEAREDAKDLKPCVIYKYTTGGRGSISPEEYARGVLVG